MKDNDKYLFLANVLFLVGAMAVPLAARYGYFATSPKTVLLALGLMLIGMCLFAARISSEGNLIAKSVKN